MLRNRADQPVCLQVNIQGDPDVFNIKQNLTSLHQGENRFPHAFFYQSAQFSR